MKFKDANGNDITNIKSIELYGLRSYDIFSFAQCKFEGTLDEKKFYIRVANNDNTPIKLQKGYAWISFLGEDKVTDFTITVRTPMVFTQNRLAKSSLPITIIEALSL